MITLNEFFDKIYCINLNRRKDRWQNVSKLFKKHNLIVERFPACDGIPKDYKHAESLDEWNRPKSHKGKLNAGEIGCALSHKAIMKIISKKKYKSVLVLEDDVDFVQNLTAEFNKMIQYLPEDWDMLYIGGNNKIGHPAQKELEIVNKYYARTRLTLTTSSYAVRQTAVKKIRNLLKDEPFRMAIDTAYTKVQQMPDINAYVMRPSLAWQVASFSDIRNAYRDYSKIMKNNKTGRVDNL
jgi:GR25 family glycosyltransferase involved in LPS biosynthesis